MSWDGTIGLDDSAAHVIEGSVERFENRAGRASRGPDHRLGGDGPARGDDGAWTDVGDHRLGAHLYTKPPQLVLSLVAQTWRVRGEEPGPALEEHDRSLGRIYVTEI